MALSLLEAVHRIPEAVHRIPEVNQADLLVAFASANFGHQANKTGINPETGQVRCGYAMYLVRDFLTPTRLAEMERCCVAMMEALLATLRQYASRPIRDPSTKGHTCLFLRKQFRNGQFWRQQMPLFNS